jgi:hypothetical protein
MDVEPIEQVVRNIDRRLTTVEQILPTLATKDELKTLATKDELRAEVARLATKDELREAVAPLATKQELADAIAPLATNKELREEGIRTRQHLDMVAERLEGQIRFVAEMVMAVDGKSTP